LILDFGFCNGKSARRKNSGWIVSEYNPKSKIQNPKSDIDLSIIIVSWNVWDLLRSSLAAIERVSRPDRLGRAYVRGFGPADIGATLEVIVVDSASTDATVSGVQALFPWVRLVASTENLGFTRGNNRGYAESQGEFVFFLNPDTELVSSNPYSVLSNQSPVSRLPSPVSRLPSRISNPRSPPFSPPTDSLWLLFDLIRHEPDVGVVGPQLRYGDGSLQSSRRRFPTVWTGFFESTWLGRLWPHNPWVERLHFTNWPADMRQEVDWVVGAALFCRRAALEAVRSADEIGPFDEGFFMYSEELDLCRRIKQAGGRVLFVPEAVVIHYEGQSSDQVPAARHIRFNTSKVRYYRKYFGAGWAETLRRYLLFEFWVQLWLEHVKGWLGHKRPLRRARIQAYREVLRSQLRTLVL
jgi:N-acetylglucosaminyl-diphospho-decaprenol L-rhamnosyltransferase